jgi:intracellular sulfur oxidation DsrE/DsrF family protein
MKGFRFLLVSALLISSSAIKAQSKIVWEMASGDTAQQRILFRQVANVLVAAPDTKIEIVFHKKGVTMAVCNNALKNRNIKTDRVIPEAVIVPVAILELVKKQEEGWSYIKAN